LVYGILLYCDVTKDSTSPSIDQRHTKQLLVVLDGGEKVAQVHKPVELLSGGPLIFPSILTRPTFSPGRHRWNLLAHHAAVVVEARRAKLHRLARFVQFARKQALVDVAHTRHTQRRVFGVDGPETQRLAYCRAPLAIWILLIFLQKQFPGPDFEILWELDEIYRKTDLKYEIYGFNNQRIHQKTKVSKFSDWIFYDNSNV